MTSQSKYNNNEQNIVVFYKIWEKNNEIQLTKNKMDLNNRKMTNHPPSPDEISETGIESRRPRLLARIFRDRYSTK